MRDPIQTIGKLLKGDELRDAIHIAILPVVAGEDLWPGREIMLAYGTSDIAVEANDAYGVNKSIGIVDPFLDRGPRKGQRFWCFMHPNTITGIQHQWRHPRVDNPPQAKSESEQWLRRFAEEWGFHYDEMIASATTPGESEWGTYITAHGRDLHSREELGEAHAEFWQHLALLTGQSYGPEHQQKVQWSCTC